MIRREEEKKEIQTTKKKRNGIRGEKETIRRGKEKMEQETNNKN